MIILVPVGKPEWLKAPGVEQAIDKIWQKFVKRPYMYKKVFLKDYYHWECYGFSINDLLGIRTLMRKHIETLSKNTEIAPSNQSATIIQIPIMEKLPVWLDNPMIREKFEKIWADVLHNPFHYDSDEYGNDWNYIRVQWISQIKMEMNVADDESDESESSIEYETESSTNEEYEYETESSTDASETDDPNVGGYACKYDNASDETEPSSDNSDSDSDSNSE
jgi:hypothetical protein